MYSVITNLVCFLSCLTDPYTPICSIFLPFHLEWILSGVPVLTTNARNSASQSATAPRKPNFCKGESFPPVHSLPWERILFSLALDNKRMCNLEPSKKGVLLFSHSIATITLAIQVMWFIIHFKTGAFLWFWSRSQKFSPWHCILVCVSVFTWNALTETLLCSLFWEEIQRWIDYLSLRGT